MAGLRGWSWRGWLACVGRLELALVRGWLAWLELAGWLAWSWLALLACVGWLTDLRRLAGVGWLACVAGLRGWLAGVGVAGWLELAWLAGWSWPAGRLALAGRLEWLAGWCGW